MNILFLSNYGKSDPRTRAFIHIMRTLGETVCVTRAVPEKTPDVDMPGDMILQRKGVKGLPEFIHAALVAVRGMKRVDILFIDNRMATIPGRLIACMYRPKFIVQDAIEFYTFQETHHFAGKIGCLFEDASLRKADVVFCANSYRAEAMRKAFRLRKLPYVFENVFTLSFDSFFKPEEAKRQYGHLFSGGLFTFLSSSGCSISRTTDRLVAAMEGLKGRAQLILVGRSIPSEEERIQKIILEKQLDNIHIIGRVDKNTLKWLIQSSDAGVAIYGKQDSNNLYCASGKIYEFLSEGLPVMTSDNPPLLAFCQKTKSGCASDNYSEALLDIVDRYPMYKRNVEEYMRGFDICAAWRDAERMLREKLKEMGCS